MSGAAASSLQTRGRYPAEDVNPGLELKRSHLRNVTTKRCAFARESRKLAANRVANAITELIAELPNLDYRLSCLKNKFWKLVILPGLSVCLSVCLSVGLATNNSPQ